MSMVRCGWGFYASFLKVHELKTLKKWNAVATCITHTPCSFSISILQHIILHVRSHKFSMSSTMIIRLKFLLQVFFRLCFFKRWEQLAWQTEDEAEVKYEYKSHKTRRMDRMKYKKSFRNNESKKEKYESKKGTNICYWKKKKNYIRHNYLRVQKSTSSYLLVSCIATCRTKWVC